MECVLAGGRQVGRASKLAQRAPTHPCASLEARPTYQTECFCPPRPPPFAVRDSIDVDPSRRPRRKQPARRRVVHRRLRRRLFSGRAGRVDGGGREARPEPPRHAHGTASDSRRAGPAGVAGGDDSRRRAATGKRHGAGAAMPPVNARGAQGCLCAEHHGVAGPVWRARRLGVPLELPEVSDRDGARPQGCAA